MPFCVFFASPLEYKSAASPNLVQAGREKFSICHHHQIHWNVQPGCQPALAIKVEGWPGVRRLWPFPSLNNAHTGRCTAHMCSLTLLNFILLRRDMMVAYFWCCEIWSEALPYSPRKSDLKATLHTYHQQIDTNILSKFNYIDLLIFLIILVYLNYKTYFNWNNIFLQK